MSQPQKNEKGKENAARVLCQAYHFMTCVITVNHSHCDASFYFTLHLHLNNPK